MAMREAQATAAAHALRALPVRAMFEGGMCMFGYYSKLPYLAETSGLTQYSLAKKPLAARGYIGHEKAADIQWLTENRIQFVFSQAWPPIPRPEPRRVDYEFLDRYYFQAAEPEKQPLADDLKAAVDARRAGKTGA